MSNPLVSVIVPTKNSEVFIEACLKSIQNQTYPDIETIVVDNFSTDNTVSLAKKFTEKVYSKGKERSSQRNYGAKVSKGEYLVFIDSDMELSPNVIEECVKKTSDKNTKGVIIPEESFGEGFWAQCKKLERSFYVGVGWMEAARFFDKEAFNKVGGWDESLVSGEDWDLSQKIEKLGGLKRIESFIFHNEGRILLQELLRKKLYYAKKFNSYKKKKYEASLSQTSLISRYKLFLSQPRKLFKNPHIGIGMLFMKTLEFSFGGLVLITQRQGG